MSLLTYALETGCPSVAFRRLRPSTIMDRTACSSIGPNELTGKSAYKLGRVHTNCTSHKVWILPFQPDHPKGREGIDNRTLRPQTVCEASQQREDGNVSTLHPSSCYRTVGNVPQKSRYAPWLLLLLIFIQRIAQIYTMRSSRMTGSRLC